MSIPLPHEPIHLSVTVLYTMVVTLVVSASRGTFKKYLLLKKNADALSFTWDQLMRLMMSWMGLLIGVSILVVASVDIERSSLMTPSLVNSRMSVPTWQAVRGAGHPRVLWIGLTVKSRTA